MPQTFQITSAFLSDPKDPSIKLQRNALHNAELTSNQVFLENLLQLGFMPINYFSLVMRKNSSFVVANEHESLLRNIFLIRMSKNFLSGFPYFDHFFFLCKSSHWNNEEEVQRFDQLFHESSEELKTQSSRKASLVSGHHLAGQNFRISKNGKTNHDKLFYEY